MIDSVQLSLAEWIVLALLAEQPRHGFAVAALTAADGDVGRAWQVPRPIVYRALTRLTELRLVVTEATERGDRGPQRSIVAATAAGAGAVDEWLTEPVGHIRDVRSELLVKLALLDRRQRDRWELLIAQRRIFTAIEDALAERQHRASGFDQVLATWRVENVRATQRFIAALLAQK